MKSLELKLWSVAHYYRKTKIEKVYKVNKILIMFPPDKCIHIRNFTCIIAITTVLLFIGFYPKWGGASLFGPINCKGGDRMICVDSCYMGCTNSTQILKQISKKNEPSKAFSNAVQRIQLNVSQHSIYRCEYTNDGCNGINGSVSCIFQILNYYYVNNSGNCLVRGCYNGSMCLYGNDVLPERLYGLVAGFKGEVWGVILVLLGVTFFVGSMALFVRIIYKNYTKINYGPIKVNFLGERTDLISPTNSEIKRYEPIQYPKLNTKK